MFGIIFGILGVITTIMLWGEHTILAIIVLLATLYQFSSLNEMKKERYEFQPEDKMQTVINILATVVIISLFIFALVN